VVRAVSFGAAQFGVLDSASLAYILGVEPLGNIKILKNTEFKYYLSVAVTDSDKSVLPAINRAIEQITPDERQAIIAKWVPAIQPVSTSFFTVFFREIVAGTVVVASLVLFVILMLRYKIKQSTKKLEEVNKILADSDKKREFEISELKKEEAKKAEDLEKIKKAILNILEDVQEERNKFETLSSRFSLATASASIGVWEWDLVNNKVIWDQKMYELYGLDNTKNVSAIVDVWHGAVHPEDKKMREDRLRQAINGKKDYDLTFRIVLPDGSIHFMNGHAIVERDNSGKPIKMIGANYDVTKEKEVDQAKSEFVSLASHQLRTPLSAINWYAEMLMDGDAGKLNEEQEKYVKEIYIGSQRMVDLVNSLLNVSRLDLGTFIIEPTIVDIIEISKSVVAELGSKIIEKHLNVQEMYDEERINFLADGKLLRIVLQNLYSNAVKYTPNKGKVDVVINVLKKASPIGGRKFAKDTLCFVVTDTGMGIPKKQQDKIFSKLFRADNAKVSETEGTGLGLYIVKSIVDQSGGQVWFTSAEGEGTTFYITFPLSGMKKKEGTKELS
jgi:signal transduction histidine kinase